MAVKGQSRFGKGRDLEYCSIYSSIADTTSTRRMVHREIGARNWMRTGEVSHSGVLVRGVMICSPTNREILEWGSFPQVMRMVKHKSYLLGSIICWG